MSHGEEKEPGIPQKVDSIDEIFVGCKSWVLKDGQDRLAEILSINSRRDPPKFYVHYEDFNKRLDEWITADRLQIDKEVIFPRPKELEEKKDSKKKKQQQNKSATPQAASATPDGGDVMDLDNLNVQGIPNEDISREDEIKKLASYIGVNDTESE